MAQTNQTLLQLKEVNPNMEFDILKVTTQGDRVSKPLFQIDRRGIFEKEVDQAVADGRADFAVHSMKDVPSNVPPDLVISSVPRRATPNDVVLYRDGLDTDVEMLVGTSSLRRLAQARRYFPEVNVRPIRGNVDTRISCLGKPFDAVILAKAGIERLKINIPHTVLPTSEFIPSPGQGALAIVSRRDDHDTTLVLESIQHMPSRAESEAERAFSQMIESGCRFPVGAYAKSHNGTIHLLCAAYPLDDSAPIKCEASGVDPTSVGISAGRQMIKQGTSSFALKWRQAVEEWK